MSRSSYLMLLVSSSFFVYSFSISQINYQESDPISPRSIIQGEDFTGSLFEIIQQELQQPNKEEIVLTSFMRLIAHVHTTQKPRTYLRSVFKLFTNVVKGAQYIDNYTFTTMLEALPKYITPYFAMKKFRGIYDDNVFDRLKAMMDNALYVKFSTQYDQFKRDPENFLDALSQELVQAAQEEINIEQLRQSFMRFLEVCMNKLIWNAFDNEKTWDSVKVISHKLAVLLDDNILEDVNELDDLYWSLIHRYCFFLDVIGPDLSTDFYERVKNDIATQQLLLLELEEQDSFLETKLHTLQRALITSQATNRAYSQGILVQ
ncbi:MAG TPA: hypothetical protein VEK38_04220 [Candidatus Bathyarchaeia archaeon]|nr:hypothetical protein [Candidatus Bathyarchaeia archaeon]